MGDHPRALSRHPFLSALRDSFPLFYPIPEVALRFTSGYRLPSLDRDLSLYSTTHTACIHTRTRRKLVHTGGIKIPRIVLKGRQKLAGGGAAKGSATSGSV